MEARRDVFQAIADPTRRQIIQTVAQRSMNLNTVADEFSISRQAVSKHIKILTECGLIIIRQEGRERFCEAKLEKLDEVAQWVEKYRKFWTSKLDALGKFLDETADEPVRPAKSKGRPGGTAKTTGKKAKSRNNRKH